MGVTSAWHGLIDFLPYAFLYLFLFITGTLNNFSWVKAIEKKQF